MVPIETEPEPDTLATDPQPAGGSTCGMDEVREQICGGVEKGGGCGTEGTQLTSYGAHSFVLGKASYTAHSASFAGFTHDDAATARYRQSLAKNDPHIQDPQNYCCYGKCTAIVVTDQAPQGVPPGMMATTRCLPAPTATSRPAKADASCPAGVVLDGAALPFVARGATGECCYQSFVAHALPPWPRPNRGRPMRIDGVSVLAATQPTAGWHDEANVGLVVDVPPPLCAALARAWLAEAQLEHASVAAFAKLSLQLLAVGAPPELIDAAHAAARDEIAHAKVAFSLASHFGGEAVGPSPVPAWAAAPSLELSTLLAETLEDGCVGETIAAREAAVAAAHATDATLARALFTIAEDETRHAELAFRVARFCVDALGAAGVAAVRALDATLAEELSRPAPSASTGGSHASTSCCGRELSAHGILCAHERAAIRREVLREVVRPCLQTLAATHGAARSDRHEAAASRPVTTEA